MSFCSIPAPPPSPSPIPTPPKWTEELSAWSSFASTTISLFALLAASAAAWISLRNLKNQNKQLQQAQYRDFQEQASKVSAWIEYDRETTLIAVKYTNFSGSPVYRANIFAIAFPKKDGDGSFRKQLLGAGGSITLPPSTEPKCLLPESEELTEAADHFMAYYAPAEHEPSCSVVRETAARIIQFHGTELFFTDSRSTRWHRTHDGTLAYRNDGTQFPQEISENRMNSTAELGENENSKILTGHHHIEDEVQEEEENRS